MEILFVIIPLALAALLFFALRKEVRDYQEGKITGLSCAFTCGMYVAVIISCLFYMLPMGIKLNKTEKPPVIEKNVEEKVAPSVPNTTSDGTFIF